MNVFRLTPLLICLCFLQVADAQRILSRVTFPIDEQQTLQVLAKAGVDLTHGHGNARNAFTTELQDFELERMKADGIRFTVDIPNLSEYRKHAHHPSRGGGMLDCQDHDFNENVPKNFELGAAGGFFTQSEILDHLDAMQILYPTLISIRRPIGNFKTWENNNIYWVRISDNAETDEAEPEILYTGLHHARELVSVSQTIYYMWYLLENYGKDPVIRQVLNNTELYFVPVVNPDGLEYNIDGYDPIEDAFTRNHRKNMRDNDGDGSFDPTKDGVDLNRNYGYEWGYDNEGSSSFEGSDTYRGPSPFSEPETQALEFFCNTHDFKLALNYHSYGNLLIYPWGFDNTHTDDSVTFINYAELLCKRNGFVYGLGIETVGYATNGDSDDWMYAERDIIAMTPEVGDPDDGFYPLRERIIPLCQSALEMNLLSARLINSLIQITDESPDFIHPGVNPLVLEFNRYGFLDEEVEISFNALSPHITQVPAPIQLDLLKFEPHQRDLAFTIDNGVQYGTPVQIEIVCKQGEYTFRDTITKVRADFSTIITDKGDLSHWDIAQGPKWGLTKAEFKSGPVSITDSPGEEYSADSHQPIVLREEVDLRNATSAYAQFWGRWDIEDHYDYVVFQASTDGENWENLCGEQSRLGSIFQLYEEPLYDGKQISWLFETTDLTSYIGQEIQLRFLLVSDGFLHKDGFYFDDFKVIIIQEEMVATEDLDENAFSVYPNPAQQTFTVQMPPLSSPSIAVYNSIGQEMYRTRLAAAASFTIDASGWSTGLYHYMIMSDDQPVYYNSISVAR